MHFLAIKIILMNTIFQTWVIERLGEPFKPPIRRLFMSTYIP